ncbi:ComEC/Rec2 family competence protein [Lachnotalea glycerini]|uniref:MBL fold metallo-hydrolase n=1 Tax=Lachnotalea glycerini TaxID=1763509 RepID=A0A371J3A3_9FIRM|nr:MBL fold metallo-hydrolase [Lachnotalea glycerini]RDY27148.1 MBL fold metallo-hydrolase [Lachnotalea glycerini]
MGKQSKKIIILEIVVLAILLTVFGIGRYRKTINQESDSQQTVNEDANKVWEPIDVTFFDVGKGDCILIETSEGAIMIDTGYDENGEDLVGWLKEREIDTLAYLILTHPDKDHIGGADTVINELNVENIIETNCEVNNDDYIQYKEAAASKGLSILTLTEEKELSIGGAQLTIYPPLSKTFEGQNDYSLVIKMIFGETDFLFAGDATEARIEELLKQIPNIQSMLLKVPYHGRLMENSEEFLEAVSPKYSIITCNKKKEYKDVMKMLTELNSEVFITKDGDITVNSDGKEMTVSQ